ncbi:MAG: hypothetical protein KQJ78_00610 [Deltaproteobacteria bacterium]|nr:hypothetical protein [Deltaproteobacteria bacterium]
MLRMNRGKSWRIGGLILALGFMLALGCETMSPAPVEPPTPAGAKEKPAQVVELGRSYDFDDIRVPTMLDLKQDKSFVFRVGDFKAGVLSFSGRVEVQSLINYFADSMGKDGWTLKGSFKYPTVALFFAKKDRTAVIRITEGTFYTDVEIWVAPV